MYLLFSFATLALMIFALVDVIQRSDADIKHLPKIAWVLFIVLIPLVGGILWFMVGREGGWGSRSTSYVEPAPRREDRFATLDEARADHGDRRVSSTEQELEALDREIEYWKRQAELKRARDAAGEGDGSPAT